MRRIASLLLALTLMLCLSLPASAHDVPDLDRLGSIQLVVRYDGEPVGGGTLTCIRVAEIINDGDNNYYFQSLIDGTILDQDEVSSPTMAKVLAAEADDRDFPEITKKIGTSGDTKGMVTFANLEPGLYVIGQKTACPGYSKLNPFLVSLPYMGDEGVYQYDLTASVKSELEREPEPTPPPTTKPGEKLPQTGQLNWPVPVLASAGMVLFAIGWALCFGRRKESNEK